MIRLKPLAEQTIVITGASSGIGRVTALAAARRGARLVLTGRDEAALRDVAETIATRGGTARHVAGDVARREDVEAVAALATDAFGGFDTWVNNAGVAMFSRLDETVEEDARRLFDTNFWGTVHGSLTALKTLKATGGALVNVGSIAGDFGVPVQGMYSASKHAVRAFTDTLRIELETEGAPVSVTLVKPAAVATPIIANVGNTTGREAKLPQPHYAPEEVAHAILYAAEHPQRDIYVGGTGRLMSLFAQAAPHLADKVSARFGEDAQLGAPADGHADNLHTPGDHAAKHDPADTGRRSLYTRATLDPNSPVAAATAASGALFDLALSILAPRRK
ncbi:SDR family NAD(P)-dependent oxidoreductase [Lichenibacterium minor]|uniref:SDR family NAD(P)-dependent oxidoreductase n=1 Tax=Lichenibacterium minor TaxID=2316528 RepID=A0A4Q2U5S7_9HYPH|nr:SDR family oxidoreductase [Lichenibacterium minor]RYC31680.1 SDR family NAD(P)-dependent oxidoreductase [Lichenibacterium minor]